MTRQVGGELLDGLDDLGPHDRVLGAVILELLAQLARRVERVVLDDDRAEPQDRVERDDVLRAVRQHDRDRVAGLHAQVAKRRGGAGDLPLELAVRRGPAEELQRRCIRIVPRRCLDDVHERTGHRFQILRHPLGVAAGPRARRIVRRHALSLRPARFAARVHGGPASAPT